MKVAEVMTKDVLAVEPDTALKEVAELLSRRQISGMPVVDPERHVLGVVSETDILVKQAGADRGRGLLGWLLAPDQRAKIEARTAGEAMTSPPITMRPERDVTEAARLMAECMINRLPIVDAEGRLVGIVARADLVRTFARPDTEIERDLREDILLDTLWIDPATVDVSVRKGEVRLAGELDTRADARLIESFARRVPGVVSVHSTLRWRRDEPRLPRSRPYVPIPPRR